VTYTLTPSSSSEDRLRQYSDVLTQTFASDLFSYEYLRWQYGDNPHGKVVGFDAYDGESLAAHYATIPVSYVLDGKTIRGVLSLNTATHPDHQGKGLFKKLAAATYDLAAEQGFQFVIGVANQNSTHGFVNRLGFSLLSPLEVRIGVGRVSHAPGKLSPRLTTEWSAEALAWRLSRPGGRYVRQGSGIYAPTHTRGIYAAMGPAAPEGLTIPSRTLLPIKMWIGLAPQRPTRGIFAALPNRLRPAPLNLILKDLSGGTVTALSELTADDIRLDLADFDAY
jgi:GNAT superfamily N-acetyltransferase